MIHQSIEVGGQFDGGLHPWRKFESLFSQEPKKFGVLPEGMHESLPDSFEVAWLPTMVLNVQSLD